MILHPRLDDHGRQVTIHSPHVPSPLGDWADSTAIATVIPEGPMPYRLNHVLFRPWKKAPADAEAWETLFGGGELEEDPPFENMGLQAAAGAVVVEPDGRVWLVAPTNGFGGSKVAFPKGRTNHMGLRTTALKEVYEESGLRVEILSHLIDVKAYDQDPGAQLERDLLPSLGAVRDFLASVLMGTQCLAFPDKTLKDFTYTPTQED